MHPDPNRNLPALVNVAVSPPPRQGATQPRRADPDDLPILTRQTPEERELAVRMGVRLPPPASADLEVGGGGELVGRPYVVVRGRALTVRAGLLTARKLILGPET